jgi:hypothetical protein
MKDSPKNIIDNLTRGAAAFVRSTTRMGGLKSKTYLFQYTDTEAVDILLFKTFILVASSEANYETIRHLSNTGFRLSRTYKNKILYVRYYSIKQDTLETLQELIRK